jgi:hypothetical protein
MTQFYFRNGNLSDADLEAIASGEKTIVEIVILKLLERGPKWNEGPRATTLIPEAFLYYAILIAKAFRQMT